MTTTLLELPTDIVREIASHKVSRELSSLCKNTREIVKENINSERILFFSKQKNSWWFDVLRFYFDTNDFISLKYILNVDFQIPYKGALTSPFSYQHEKTIKVINTLINSNSFKHASKQDVGDMLFATLTSIDIVRNADKKQALNNLKKILKNPLAWPQNIKDMENIPIMSITILNKIFQHMHVSREINDDAYTRINGIINMPLNILYPDMDTNLI